MPLDTEETSLFNESFALTTKLTATNRKFIQTNSPWAVKLSWQHSYVRIFHDDLKPSKLSD